MVVKTTPPDSTESLRRRSAPPFRLRRRLSQQVTVAGEGTEELVVKVVAVSENDDGRILHSRFEYDCPGVEGHGQTLA